MKDDITDGDFIWQDGSNDPVSYTNWSSMGAQPNDGTFADCVMLNYGSEWFDVGCDGGGYALYPLCEK